MRNSRALVVILSSVIVGAAAVAVASHWVVRQAHFATVKVVVAGRDLEVGTRLRADMLDIVDWPAGLQIKESFADPRVVSDRVINAPVLRGEPILAAKLAPIGELGGLSAVLDEGQRAITVKVNEVVGVAGFALPGNYVDVMVNAPDEAERPVSKIVLERILVLAVAQDVSTGDTKPRIVNAVTLEVTPQQAEQLDLARSIGSLSLVLRSQNDRSSSVTSGARRNDLLKTDVPAREQRREGNESAPVVVPAPASAPKSSSRLRTAAGARAPPDTFEVIRGLKRSLE
jgi:pilus assembly protein CpaB